MRPSYNRQILSYECEEVVNLRKLAFLVKNYLQYPLGSFYNGLENFVEKDVDANLLKVKKYLLSFERDGDMGRKKVEYRKKKNGQGRKYTLDGEFGLINMSRIVRHTIANEYHTDYDFKNCHPEIVLQLTNIWLPTTTGLKYYCENRDVLKKKYPPIKTDLLELLNGSKGYNTMYRRMVRAIRDEAECDAMAKVYDSYKRDIEKIHDHLRENHQTRLKQLSKTNPDNPVGSLMSEILCEHEDACLNAVIREAMRQNLSPSSLAYDGLTLPSDKQIDLDRCMESVRDYTGFKLSFIPKAMDEGYDLDNDPEYQNFTDEDYEQTLMDARESIKFHEYEDTIELVMSGRLSEFDLVNIYFNHFPSDALYYNGQYYTFQNHIWRRANTPLVLLERFDEMILGMIGALTTLSRKMEMNGNQTDHISAHCNKLNGFRNNSKATSFINLVTMKITWKENSKPFDNNDFLIAFKNGVFDLKTLTLRDGTPEDMISHQCPFDKKTNKGYDTMAVDKMIAELSKVQPNNEQLENWLTLRGTTLSGLMPQIIEIWTGFGANGKDTLLNLHNHIFPDHTYLGNQSCLRENGSSGASPELANMNHMRWNVFNEVNGMLNASTLKNMTGSKQLNARQLYSNDTVTTLKSHTTLICNQAPQLSEADYAVARRIAIFDFPVNFVSEENLNPNDPNSQVADKRVDTDEWRDSVAQDYIEALVYGWIRYQNNNYDIRFCDRVKNNSSDYLRQNDAIANWLSESLRLSGEKYDDVADVPEDEITTVREIYAEYKLSSLYRDMTKQQRRIQNQKWFVDKVRRLPFLKSRYRQRYQPRVNGRRIDHRNIIMGCRLHVKEDDELF
jgi:phage/plasmid-associated DNA primase